MAKIRYMQAIKQALEEELERDPSVFYIGQDAVSGVMGPSGGLVDKFGEKRIVNTPVSEAATTGLVIGAAMKGLRPIMEFGINTLQYVAMEMMVNQAIKLRYMTGGQYNIPITWLIPASGAGNALAAQHSDSTWAQLIHMGLKVMCPSNAYDMKGMLKAAVRDNDPVAIYMPRFLLSGKDEVPDEEYVVPVGKGAVKREGTDATVIAVGHLVPEALRLAKKYEEKEISLEVIDPRTLYPVDKDIILESVKKTGKVVVADDGYRMCSWSSEIAAMIAEDAFEYLKAPVRRVTRPMVYPPASRPLEAECFPSGKHLNIGICKLLGLEAEE